MQLNNEINMYSKNIQILIIISLISPSHSDSIAHRVTVLFGFTLKNVFVFFAHMCVWLAQEGSH